MTADIIIRSVLADHRVTLAAWEVIQPRNPERDRVCSEERAIVRVLEKLLVRMGA